MGKRRVEEDKIELVGTITDNNIFERLQIQSRVNYNLSYFSSNYAAVIAMLGIWGLINNLWLLFVLIFVVVGVFGIGKLEGRDLDVGFARAVSATSPLFSLVMLITDGIICRPLPSCGLVWSSLQCPSFSGPVLLATSCG
jgi:uncharacterized membrane protein